MTYSLSCEAGEHEKCMRRSCSCFCGHPKRQSVAERDAVLAAPRNSLRESRNATFGASSEVEKPEPRWEVFKRPRRGRKPRTRAPAPPIERPCRTPGCEGTRSGRFLFCEPCREERSRPKGRTGPALIDLPVEELVSRYLGGEGIVELAEAYGVSHKTIRNRLLGAGATMRSRGGHNTRDLPVEELVARYAEGEGLHALAASYSSSPMTIRARLTAAGVTIREPGRNRNAPVFDPDELREAYESGLRLVDVAALFGTHKNRIRDLLVEAGVTIRPRAWKPLPELELKARYEAGEPARTLAADYGVDEGTIRAHLRRFGVTIRPGGPDRPDVDVDELTRRYHAGESTETLAVAFGCSPQTVTRRLKAAGVELRERGVKPNGAPKRIDLNGELPEVIRRYRLGWSLEDLGVEYGCSMPTIRARLVEAGVEIRGQGKRGDGIRRG